MTTREKILQELGKVKRKGMQDLIKWLDTCSDYFTAPASTKYHGSYKGGLADHSWNVFVLLKEKNDWYKLGLSEETIIICGLLHDACKINHYVPYGKAYKVNDEYPTGGHGEKSVFILQRFIQLTDEEQAMIRWHMNKFDPALWVDYPNGYAFQKACKKWPGVVALFTADYEATSFVERD